MMPNAAAGGSIPIRSSLDISFFLFWHSQPFFSANNVKWPKDVPKKVESVPFLSFLSLKKRVLLDGGVVGG